MRQRRSASPLRRQIVWATSTLTAFAMVLLVLVTQMLLRQTVDGNIDSVLRDRVATAQSLVDSAEGGPGSADFDELAGDAAVFGPGGDRLAGTLPAGLDDAVRDLATVREERVVEVEEATRLLAVPYAVDGRTGVIVVAESVVPYERAELYALVVSLVLGLVTVAGVAALSAWTVRRTLAPVAAMAATADEWRVHDLSRRFDLGPGTTELTALGATLDGLLDRVASALRAEQRLTAEMAHELRTPLTALVGSADVALLRTDLDPATRAVFEDIRAAARRMAETVTALVHLARSEGAVSADTSTVAQILASVTGADVEVDEEVAAVSVALPSTLAARALAPLLDNARVHRRTSTRVSAEVSADCVDLVVHDDGPGVDPDVGDVFAPGIRQADSAGSGLGLPLSRRIARAAGGDVVHEPTPSGARFVLRLPRW